MLFSDPEFLFFFLPIALCAALLIPKPFKNPVLFLVSLLFYAAGEGTYLTLMLASIVFNYACALYIDLAGQSEPRRKAMLTFSVVGNIGALIWFKYIGFFAQNANSVLGLMGVANIPVPVIHLPVGISFFTFQAMSYVIDVYRHDLPALRNPLDFGLYISLFPQLIAGPIVRTKTVVDEIYERSVSASDFSYGAQRFIVGLGKKLILADTLAVGADKAFDSPANFLTPSLAWLGLVCYALQIYYDFSGYSDMAIGMGRMMGFRFLENFRYPYYAQSVTEFWRRWHISLSTWFRDYLYIPLGGNRVRKSRIYLNLIIVFALCGIWHGANWTFILWGLWHGVFLIGERAGFGRWIKRRHRVVRHVYTVLATLLPWVLFRAANTTQAWVFFKALIGLGAVRMLPTARIQADLFIAMAAGILFAMPTVKWIKAWWTRKIRIADAGAPLAYIAGRTIGAVTMSANFLVSAGIAASGTHNPFIYFRF